MNVIGLLAMIVMHHTCY